MHAVPTAVDELRIALVPGRDKTCAELDRSVTPSMTTTSEPGSSAQELSGRSFVNGAKHPGF
jgi:hypothetical protein